MKAKTKVKKRVEPYLKVPYEILNLSQIGLCEKVLLAHIHSFGVRGCWQSNATLAEIFQTSERTICRWVAALRRHVHTRNSKGYFRTLWARCHPDVKAAAAVGKLFDKADPGPQHADGEPAGHDKSGEDPRQNWRSDYAKSGNRLRQNCRTTSNTTITETMTETIAPPSPLPAGGQAPAALQARRRQRAVAIEQFKGAFGRGRSAGSAANTETIARRKAGLLAQLDGCDSMQRLAARIALSRTERNRQPLTADQRDRRKAKLLSDLARVEMSPQPPPAGERETETKPLAQTA